MNHLKNLAFFIVLLVIISGCSVYSVLYTDQDQSVDFTTYKTFAWLPHEDNQNTPYHNQIIENNTRNYLSHEFMARGLVVNVDTPDILLQLIVTEEAKQQTEQVPVYTSIPPTPYNNPYANPYNNPYKNPYNLQPNYNPYQYQATSPTNPYYNPNNGLYNYSMPPQYNYPSYSTSYITKVTNYTQSTITLNVIDRKSNIIVWTSVVAADLYDPSQMKNSLHPAVHRILESYPVNPIKPEK